MKVVVYHANGPKANEFAKDLYKDLFKGLKENVNSFGYPLIHLTLKGFEGWGDENYFYDGNPNEVIYNREKICLEYLRSQPDDESIYWFTEPDSRIMSVFEPLDNDLALLLRKKDGVPVTPAWKLCRKKALPFLEDAFSYFDLTQKEWNGDAYGYVEMYNNVGRPTSNFQYKDVKIELRSYRKYCTTRGPYSTQFKAKKKYRIVTKDFFESNTEEILKKLGLTLEEFRRKYGV
jgi:hypothetical protein